MTDTHSYTVYLRGHARNLQESGNPHSAQAFFDAALHMEQLEADLLLYKNALWKACGDDEETVEATLESQR